MRKPFLLLACLAGGCADKGAETIVKLGEATYRLPDSHIRSITREPHQFVRLKAPEHSFELVYDSRIDGRAGPQGWPVIFSLNDDRAPNVERLVHGDLKIVCRRAVNPRGGCGIEVRHGGTDWDVLFPRDRMPQAHSIEREALAALDLYRSGD